MGSSLTIALLAAALLMESSSALSIPSIWSGNFLNASSSPQLYANKDRRGDFAPLALAVLTLAIPAWIILESRRLRRTNVPIMGRTPQGGSFPWIGHAITFLRHTPWDLITQWHRDSKSSIVCFRLLGTLTFSVASPMLVKAILQSKISHTKKDVENAMKPFLSILGTGIVSSEGDHWFRQRRNMSHPLRFDVLKYIPGQTMKALERLFITLDQAAESKRQVPMGALLRHLTLQVISGTFLSLSAQESDEQFAKLYLPIVEESNTRVWHPYRRFCFFLPSFWEYHSNVWRLNAYVSSLIRKRWNESHSADTGERIPDILDTMLATYRRDHSTLSTTAVRQFRDEIKTFMLAGHETSAAMMTWTLYELIHNPYLIESIREEGSPIWKNTKENLSPEHLSTLELAECCLKESLRKYSVVPMVARLLTKDLSIDDYFLPKGSAVMVDIVGVHLDPSIWPKPLLYDPYRFYRKTIPPFTFLPFIAGPRNCLGQNLALLESKMVISLLLQKYKFSLDQPVNDTSDWTGERNPRHHFMIPVIPKQEVMLNVEKLQ